MVDYVIIRHKKIDEIIMRKLKSRLTFNCYIGEDDVIMYHEYENGDIEFAVEIVKGGQVIGMLTDIGWQNRWHKLL